MNQAELYQQIGLETDVLNASPYRLIFLLLKALQRHLISAQQALNNHQIHAKGQAIRNALDIVIALRQFLDIKRGGELAENLDRVYDYIEDQLIAANLAKTDDVLVSLLNLVDEILLGWVGIKDDTEVQS